MAPLFRNISLLTVIIPCLSTLSSMQLIVNAQTIDKPTFTSFDLFKNSGFTLCNNGSTPVQSILPRSPDPRGGRGGSRGGSGGGGGGGVGGAAFIKSVNLPKKADYCKYLNGTGVILPTKATQQGFFPWWPTYSLQLFSLALSYVALRISFNRLQTYGKLPIIFWPLLAIDSIRIIGWFVKSVHGLADHTRFAWPNPVLWLLPLAYTTLFYYKGFVISTNIVSYTTVAYGGNQPYDSKLPAVTTTQRSKGSKLASLPGMIIYGLLTIIMWCMSLAFTIYHWNTPTNATSRTWAYLELDGALKDPAILGNIPAPCATYLKLVNLPSLGIFDQSFDQLLSAGFSALAFVVACLAMINRATKRLNKNLTSEETCKGIVGACMAGTIVALGLGLIATAIYVGVTAGQNKRVELRYTNNLDTTRGCTFAFVNMDKQWGYWDVKQELGYRIVMSLLGAS